MIFLLYDIVIQNLSCLAMDNLFDSYLAQFVLARGVSQASEQPTGTRIPLEKAKNFKQIPMG